MEVELPTSQDILRWIKEDLQNETRWRQFNRSHHFRDLTQNPSRENQLFQENQSSGVSSETAMLEPQSNHSIPSVTLNHRC